LPEKPYWAVYPWYVVEPNHSTLSPLPIMTNPLTTTDGNRWKKGIMRNQLENGVITQAKKQRKVLSLERSCDPAAKDISTLTKRLEDPSQS